MMSDERFIEVRGLRKEYGSVIAVERLDLSISKGDIVTLLGPSGCGKTTTLRCIAGLETPTAGTITIAGVETDRDEFHALPRDRNIGMVFQGFALWPHMRVMDNVAFPLRRKGFSRDEVMSRTEAVLSLVGLTGRADHFPGQLSGGQQQRVALARALVAEPKVILYDEPLSSLDAKLREQIRNEIRDLHKRLSITAVYVTHDQEEAMDISDFVYVMQGGKIVQGGAPVEVSDKPKDLFVCEFFGRANVFPLTDFTDTKNGLIEGRTKEGLRLFGEMPDGAKSRPSHIAVRPHRIQLVAAEVGDWNPGLSSGNTFRGKVISVRHYGTRFRYEVMLNEGIKLDVEAIRIDEAFNIGAEVVARFSARDCMPLEQPASNKSTAVSEDSQGK